MYGDACGVIHPAARTPRPGTPVEPRSLRDRVPNRCAPCGRLWRMSQPLAHLRVLLGLSLAMSLTACETTAAGNQATAPAATITASAPTHAPTGAQASPQRSLSSSSSAVLGKFEVSKDKPKLEVPQAWHPYAQVDVSPLGTGIRDATGVAMYKRGSKIYDHPVRQAQQGLLALESFRISKHPRYLAQAVLDAQRLLDRKVQRGAGSFFPYPFDFALHSDSANMIHAPWYSGMAQGQALSLFSRLAEVTKKPSWRLAADAAFESLLLPPDPQNTSLPFVSWVDSERHLWIEEYAQQPLAKADRTFNGHIFATFGVWDYFRISQDPRAEKIFAGALENVRYHVNRGWRTPFWISRYCLTHGQLDAKYHQIHVEQLRTLHAITGSSDWSLWSDRFQDDHPAPKLASTVRFRAGKLVGHRFDRNGKVLAARDLILTRSSKAPASLRARIRSHPGYYYLIRAGSLSGYWVREEADAVHAQGSVLSTTYPYKRLASFAPGRHTGWAMTATGIRTGSRTISLNNTSSASFDRSAWIDGASYVRMTNGALAGRWVRTSRLTLH